MFIYYANKISAGIFNSLYKVLTIYNIEILRCAAPFTSSTNFYLLNLKKRLRLSLSSTRPQAQPQPQSQPQPLPLTFVL